MNNSPIEKEFINWCNFLHPDIKSYIFLQRYNRYSEDYYPLLDENMTQLHQKISNEKPNINFSFKGRIKSKRSFLIKTFRTIAENIVKIFPNEFPNDPTELEDFLTERNASIEKFFKFLINENPARFNEIQSLICKMNSSCNTLESFRTIFSLLNSEEQEKLITRLGRTEDTFAYRPIVHSIDFNIKSILQNENNEFEVIDDEGNHIPIHTSVTFDPEKDIIQKSNGLKYININGKEEKLNERNLLYPRNISASERNIKNALKTPDGKLTLLHDSLVINDTKHPEHFDIISLSVDPISNDILAYNQSGECRNLTLLLNSFEKTQLRKTDEEYTIPAIYSITNIIQDYYDNNNIIDITSRSKDYIKNPKQKTGYRSIHKSSFDELFGYTMEAQIRDLKMEDECKDESTSTGHDQYKQDKLKNLLENPILAPIVKRNPLAFDSSTFTLIKILDDPNVELSELLAKYILVTKMKNGISVSYQPSIDKVFEHTFEFSDISTFIAPEDPAPPLDISSYKNFIKSRKIRNEFKRKEDKFPDIYE